MSGVYIKGMQMPECCAYCVCLEVEDDIRCRISGKIVGGTIDFNCFDPRPSDCPLIPVPYHGRLIDGDEIIKEDHQHYEYFSDTFYVTVRDIELAPTIIPADKEGEE